jgi:DNA-binding LytR/AlgR family response regulator
MNIILLEDETRAANRLERLIRKLAPEMQLLAKIESVSEAICFLSENQDISLIFADVQLADGLSFEIFEKVKINCPIIFTTAYDQYAIEAFKTNGIDYLLKPIEEERLNQAIEKHKKLSTPSFDFEKLIKLTNAKAMNTYKSRFMIKVGDKIKSIPIHEIKAFYSYQKATYLLTNTNRNYIVDFSLDQLEMVLDPSLFFKINRKYILPLKSCNDILAWSNSRLKLTIDGLDDPEIVVARERVQDFKKWLDR